MKDCVRLLLLKIFTEFFSFHRLDNGGASIGDVYSFVELLIYFFNLTVASLWSPFVDLIMSVLAVEARGWHWGLW